MGGIGKYCARLVGKEHCSIKINASDWAASASQGRVGWNLNATRQ